MAQATRTFRIFVSSTFNDLKEERNALQKYVFPRLRDLCAQHGCRFQAIDLRWGVGEEASLDQQTMKICLGEIERCQKISPRPNFIVLLGDRYGWRPLPYEIPAAEFELLEQAVADPGEKDLLHRWYRRDDNNIPPVYGLQPRTGEYTGYEVWEQKAEQPLRSILQRSVEQLPLPDDAMLKYFTSATEQEIMQGAMRVADAPEHVFCFFRSIQGMPEDASAKEFFDYDEDLNRPDSEARTRIKLLKENLKKHLPNNWNEYGVKWENQRPSTDYIGSLPDNLQDCYHRYRPDIQTASLCEDVWLKLSEVILNEIIQSKETELKDQETAQHDKFRKEKSRCFVGRDDILQAISAYLHGDQRTPCMVAGIAGSGKSAVMARAAEMAKKEHPNAIIISRFIGATLESSDYSTLMHSLCSQLDIDFQPQNVRGNYTYIDDFKHSLNKASPDKPVIIFVDAVDQISDSKDLRDLARALLTLPENAKLVFSCLSGLEFIEERLPAESICHLELLRPDESQALLLTWLKDAGRTLQPDQFAEIIPQARKNGLPFYLKLLFEEIRHWPSFQEAGEIDLGLDTGGFIEKNLFPRLNKDHGRVLVSKSLGYITASRFGLSEDEMMDILSRDQEVVQDFKKRAQHDIPEEKLPIVIWSRLYFDLEPYLIERNALGAAVFSLYNQQLFKAVDGDLLSGNTRVECHQQLAGYFGGQNLWISRTYGRNPNFRKLSELPFHQVRGKLWQDLEGSMCSLEFIEAKCAAGMINDLMNDFRFHLDPPAIDKEISTKIEDYREFVTSQRDILKNSPDKVYELFNQRLINEAYYDNQLVSASIFKQMMRWLGLGLSESINSCAFSPDGRKFVAGTEEGLSLYDIDNGCATLTRPAVNINACSFSPRGSVIVSGSARGRLIFTDADKGKVIKVISKGIGSAVEACRFSPDGNTVMVGCSDGIKFFDVHSYICKMTIMENSRVAAGDFSPDGKRVIYATKNQLKLCALEDGAISASDRAFTHERKINDCRFSPDGTKCLSCSQSGELKVWDVNSGNCLHTLKGNMGVFTPDGQRVVSGGMDGTIRGWNLSDGSSQYSYSCKDSVTAMSINPTGDRILVGFEDGTLAVYRFKEAGVGSPPIAPLPTRFEPKSKRKRRSRRNIENFLNQADAFLGKTGETTDAIIKKHSAKIAIIISIGFWIAVIYYLVRLCIYIAQKIFN